MRLLELYSTGSGHHGGGRVLTCTFENAPDYEAISYCWSNEVPTHELVVDGCIMHITPTVAQALERLRQSTESRYLWVDAICINQDDLQERTQQVRQMETIYTHASKVIIWLGEEDHMTSDAYEIIEDAWQAVSAARELPSDTPSLDDLYNSGLPKADDQRWSALQGLILHPWFTRTWILQEAALNDEPIIQRGSHTCHWRRLARVILNMIWSSATNVIHLDISWITKVAYIDAREYMGTVTHLLGLLMMTVGSASSNRRDKVYALIGLASDKEHLTSLIDYTKSVAEVYTDVAHHYLTQGDISVLNLASDPAWRNERMPTWVPDWSADARAWTLLGRGFTTPAISDTKNRPYTSLGRKMLHLKGIQLDVVRATGRHLPSARDDWEFVGILLFIQQWRHIAEKSQAYRNRSDLHEAFARTLVTNTTPIPEPCDLNSIYLAWMSIRLGSSQRSREKTDGELLEIAHFEQSMRSVCIKRTFFLTRNGHIGMGPYFMRPSDTVFNIYGGATPFVLRKTGKGSFSLVGEAYVHGFVDRTATSFGACESITLV